MGLVCLGLYSLPAVAGSGPVWCEQTTRPVPSLSRELLKKHARPDAVRLDYQRTARSLKTGTRRHRDEESPPVNTPHSKSRSPRSHRRLARLSSPSPSSPRVFNTPSRITTLPFTKLRPPRRAGRDASHFSQTTSADRPRRLLAEFCIKVA